MDEEKLRQIDSLTSKINMDLEILNNAIKCMEYEGAKNITAITSFVENIYQKSEEIRKIF